MWDTIDDDNIYEEPELDSIFDEAPRKRTRRAKDGKETIEYVSKDEMWNELYNYYTSLGENYDWGNQKVLDKNVSPTISKRLTDIVIDIATKMGYRANFCTYSWLEEMIGDATLKMIKAIRDCSFKCYTTAEIISTVTEDGVTFISFVDKKGVAQKRQEEESDEFFEENGIKYVKFKANPFGYFSRITTHSYLNRIKKEKTLEDTKRAFQTETWEKLYSNENFRNVRRPKYMDSDENEEFFD